MRILLLLGQPGQRGAQVDEGDPEPAMPRFQLPVGNALAPDPAGIMPGERGCPTYWWGSPG